MSRLVATKTAPQADGQDARIPVRPGELVVIGKDILELLSSAMYVDPLSIYREYVQNSADAIQEARQAGLLANEGHGQISITVDFDSRTVVLRDNGAGIPADNAARRLLAIGASAKRGTKARGFRGIGRLAGLAYCQELIFRTRADGDTDVVELQWDCIRLRAALRAIDEDDDLPAVVDKIVSVARRSATEDEPAHFFEVELRDIVRHHRHDALLNEQLIAEYLSEVAPVPFDDCFSFGSAIRDHLSGCFDLPNLDIRVNGSAPLRRPHRDLFPAKTNLEGHFSECELLTFEDRDSGVAAVGWLLHHEYLGAIPSRARIKGVRLRSGDIQIGDDQVLEAYFPEPRFNSWTVAELHVVDPHVIPNARRDHFEQNVHFNDLTAQFEPLARQIARRCREASIERNRFKALQSASIGLTMELVKEPSAQAGHTDLLPKLAKCVAEMRSFLRRFGTAHRETQLEEALKVLEGAITATSAPSDVEG